MGEPSKEGLLSTPVTNGTSFLGNSTSRVGGFYSTFIAERSISTPCKPSFLDQTKSEVLPGPSKRDNPSSVLKSNPSQNHSFRSMLKSTSTPITPVSSFGVLKRKRPVDVVEKPSFKVSELVDKEPCLPAFGTSLPKAKFDFTQNRSMFYSGRTTFGGSSAIREEPAKRIKISPVSKNIRSNLTQVSLAKPYTNEHRTLTSKTAENILKTLNKIALPFQSGENKSQHVDHSSSFASLSKRVREKRKTEISLPRLPLERLNQIKPVDLNIVAKDDTEPKVTANTETTTNNETTAVSETNKNSTEEKINDSPIVASEVPDVTLKSEKADALPTDSASVLSKNGLKMKRQRASTHYTASEKIEDPVNTMPEVTAVEPLVITSLPTFDISVKPTLAKTKLVPAPVTAPVPESIKATEITETVHLPASLVETVPDPSPKLEPKLPSAPKPVVLPVLDSEKKSIPDSDPKPEITPIPTPIPIKKATLPVAPIFTPIMKPNKVKIADTTNNEFMFSSPKTISDKDIDTESTEVPFTFISPLPVKDSNTSVDLSQKDIFNPPPGKLFALSPVKEVTSEKDESKLENLKPTPFASIFNAGKPAEGSWECPTCMITNKSDCLNCLACNESKPGSKGNNLPIAPSFSFGTGNAPSNSEPAFGKTSFASTTFSSTNVSSSTGFTFSKPFTSVSSAGFSFGNVASASPGIVASKEPIFSLAKKPDTKDSTNVEVGTPELNNVIKPSPFAAFNAASNDSWECPTCMVNNKLEILKCVACSESKPGTENTEVLKPEVKLGGTNSSAKFSFGTTDNSSVSGGFSFEKTAKNVMPVVPTFGTKTESSVKPNSLFANFKPPEGSWSCPTCMVDNGVDLMKCAACTEPKPGVDQSAVSTSAKSEFKFGMIAPEVNGSSKPPEFSFKAAAAASNVFMKFTQPEGAWECPTCMVSNKVDCLKCVACSETKPGSNSATESVPADDQSTKKTGFSFGATADTKSVFSFGTKEETKPAFSFAAQEGTKSGFSFGTNNTKPAFSFSVKEESKTVPLPRTTEITKSENSSVDSIALSNGGSNFSFVSKSDSVPISISSSSDFSIVPSVPSVESIPSTDSSQVSFGKGLGSSGFTFGSNGSSNAAFTFGSKSSTSLPNLFNKPSTETNSAESNGPVEVKAAASMFNFKGTSTGAFGFSGSNKTDEKTVIPSSNSIFGSVAISDSSNVNGAPSLPAPQFNFNSPATNGPSFLLNSNDSKPNDPAKFSFNPTGPISAPNFNFGGTSNVAAVFGTPSSTGQFNFTNNNNTETSKGMFSAPPPSSGNLFTIGGGGSPNVLNNNTGPTGRRVKRAHRKLPMRK